MFKSKALKRIWYLVIILFLISICGGPIWAKDLIVHFIDVGQGDSTLIQSPEGASILIDAGTTKGGREVVVPYLAQLGIGHLDLVVMTHPHADHIGGLLYVLDACTVGQVLADGQIHTSQTYEELLGLILHKEIPFTLARAGDTVTVQGIDEIRILNPREPYLKGLNNNSVVLWIRYGEFAVLLTGDVEAEAEDRILAQERFPSAEVLKVAHHGSDTSSGIAFLQAVEPRFGVISVGGGNSYGHPKEEVLRNLAFTGTEVLRTDYHGTVTITTDGLSYRVVTEKGQEQSVDPVEPRPILYPGPREDPGDWEKEKVGATSMPVN